MPVMIAHGKMEFERNIEKFECISVSSKECSEAHAYRPRMIAGVAFKEPEVDRVSRAGARRVWEVTGLQDAG